MESNKQIPDFNDLSDLTLTCVDCGREFVFTKGQQAYFKSKSLSVPKRCKPCLERRRATLVKEVSHETT